MRFSRESVDPRLESLREEAEVRDAKRRAASEGLSYFDKKIPIDKTALVMASKEDSQKAAAAIISASDKEISVVVYSSKKPETISFINKLTANEIPIKIYITTSTYLEKAWAEYQNIKPENKREDISKTVSIGGVNTGSIETSINKASDMEDLLGNIDEKTPTTEVLSKILTSALKLQASDVHIEPISEETSSIRLRIDGVLKNSAQIPYKTSGSLIRRVKLLAELKLNIREAPQDGRFTIKNEWGDVEVRVSIIPTEHGEAAVLRILDPRNALIDLENLGIRKDDTEVIYKELKRANGMILLTGPTGSGKTTTLYSFLKQIKTPEIKIVTIENPIEYHIEGIEQTQVNESTGYSFSTGLRSILRHDPDIILVGEIRDKETAEVAIQAALTGHLVFSTLHTNNAAGAIPRLIDLGTKASVIGPAIVLIIAQRLVRVLCPICKKEVEVNEDTKIKIQKFKDALPKRITREIMGDKIYEAVGCNDCTDGYRGRIAISELLRIDEHIGALLKEDQVEGVIQNEAIAKQGMVLIQQDGIIKILEGATTIEEVERETGPLEW